MTNNEGASATRETLAIVEVQIESDLADRVERARLEHALFEELHVAAPDATWRVNVVPVEVRAADPISMCAVFRSVPRPPNDMRNSSEYLPEEGHDWARPIVQRTLERVERLARVRALAALSDDEIERRALDDPDNPPATAEELSRMRPLYPHDAGEQARREGDSEQS